jgi:hypothetical protein
VKGNRGKLAIADELGRDCEGTYHFHFGADTGPATLALEVHSAAFAAVSHFSNRTFVTLKDFERCLTDK